MKEMQRVRLRIEGRVQGVGFRPAVYRLARRLALSGFVNNTSWGVLIEVQGSQAEISKFISCLQSEKPRQAVIASLETEEVGLIASEKNFLITESKRSGDLRAGMPPDMAICDSCRQELFDSADRRHLYPFINCVDCGPRFTIIRKLPYDRERTSMKKFKMCPACSAEFSDPANRRFEAQPNACPVCGPKIRLIDGKFKTIKCAPIEGAVNLLKSGKILAVKGVGGYHLCCDALNSKAVGLLRKRKNRLHKPLAIMFKSLEQIRRHCPVNDAEAAELTSVAAPIVILPKRQDSRLAANLAPDTDDIGVFLPYSPLHCLLLEKISPLVMTSGNRLDEPTAIDDIGLKTILGVIADAALTHNREIERRCDDSVLKLSGKNRIILRRSRGFVPGAIRLPLSGPPVLACGAELKNTVCVTRGDLAFLSAHIGDLDDMRNYDFFLESARSFMELLEHKPEIAAYDMHPDYMSTRFALSCGKAEHCGVQHHHAHIASCLAEHLLTEKVIGIALDGTGFGPDGTIWGGELMIADLRSFERVGHFKQYPMPGGGQAVLNPARMALSYLASEFKDGAYPHIRRLLPSIPVPEVRILTNMVKRNLRSPLTSSAGRLFDAVSALLGFSGKISYEGQAAIRLQSLADRNISKSYSYKIQQEKGMLVISFFDTIRGIIDDLKRKHDVRNIAGMFHNTMVEAIAEACVAIRKKHGLNQTALSGGVFQNDLLLEKLTARLKKNKFKVYINKEVPPNDGGIAFGQAAVAAARSAGKDVKRRS